MLSLPGTFHKTTQSHIYFEAWRATSFLKNVATPGYVTPSDMQTTAAPSLPASSFTIARYHVKLMPSFDIITSTGFIETIFRYSFKYLLQTRHFNVRLIENTSIIRWKIRKCEYRSFSPTSWEIKAQNKWCRIAIWYPNFRYCYTNPTSDLLHKITPKLIRYVKNCYTKLLFSI
jgi:hypothetical protein